MVQDVQNIQQFYLGLPQYRHIRLLGWLFLGGLLVCALLCVMVGIMFWQTYTHEFTPYLKWQDILLALCWYIAFVALGGSILSIRFLYALYVGYTKGMLTLIGKQTLNVRDLAPENLWSIFWIMTSAFWCFIAVLIGLFPEILIGWTLHLPDQILVVISTSIAIILSIAGLVVSIISVAFIIVGCIGGTSFGRKLGSSHIYQLNNQVSMRIDNFVLTVIYPALPESMLDLRLLVPEDQRQLLALLHECWMDTEQIWNPTLGEEIEMALQKVQTPLPVPLS